MPAPKKKTTKATPFVKPTPAAAARLPAEDSLPLPAEPLVNTVPLQPIPRLKTYLAGFMIALGLFATGAALSLTHMTMSGWEISVFRAVNGLPDGLRIVGLVATVTPESTLIGAVVVGCVFLLKQYRLAWRLAIGIIGGYAVVAVAKQVIGRARPTEILSDVQLRAHDSGMGFPSGHTMIVTVIMLMLLPYIPGKWKLLVPVPIVVMAWSRVYLGLHAPLDIVGGFAVGLGVVCFLRILPAAMARFFKLD